MNPVGNQKFKLPTVPPTKPNMKKIFLLVAAVLFSIATRAQVSTNDTSSADRLGWKLAVHSYTFQKFTIFDAIDKTAALGVKYMSISGSVILDGTKTGLPPLIFPTSSGKRLMIN